MPLFPTASLFFKSKPFTKDGTVDRLTGQVSVDTSR